MDCRVTQLPPRPMGQVCVCVWRASDTGCLIYGAHSRRDCVLLACDDAHGDCHASFIVQFSAVCRHQTCLGTAPLFHCILYDFYLSSRKPSFSSSLTCVSQAVTCVSDSQ